MFFLRIIAFKSLVLILSSGYLDGELITIITKFLIFFVF